MTPRCASQVYWWDCDLTTRCHRPEQHTGDHRDPLRAWDDDGMQVDGVSDTRPATRRRVA